MNVITFRSLAVAAVLAVPVASMAQLVEFAQIDIASNSSSLVLVSALARAAPAPLLSATASRWSTGEAAAVGYVHRWALVEGAHHWIVGAGVGANLFRSRAAGDSTQESGVSARVQTEAFGQAAGGDYYALAQASSFRHTWLGVLQYAPSGQPIAFEWLRYHENSYQASTAALRLATGVPHWFVRLGALRANGQTRPFVGVTYNAF